MKKLALLIATLAVVSVFSCKKEKQIINTIAGLDISQSRDKSIVQWYYDAICNGILLCTPSQSVVTVLPIDNGSQTATEELLRADFSANDYSNPYSGLNADKLERKMHTDSTRAAAQQLAATVNASTVSRTQMGRGSDILGFLRQAKVYKMKNCLNVIVLFSDMLQNADGIYIDIRSEEKIEHFFEALPEIDLDGFDIHILTGQQPAISTTTYLILKDKWTKYLTSCGATVVNYSTGGLSQLKQYYKEQE